MSHQKKKHNPRGRCVWQEDGDGNWDTECGEKHILLNGGPDDNSMTFCCYCGGSLTERKATSDDL